MKKMFGLYLRQYRIKKNIAQSEFAKLLGINDKYLSQIENQKLKPSYKVINGFLNYSQMTIEDLQLEVENMNDNHTSIR